MINQTRLLLKIFALGLLLSISLGQNQTAELEARLAFEKSFSVKVDLLNELSLKTFKLNEDSSRTYARRALLLADSIEYYRGESVALRRLGQNERRAGRYDDALSLFEQALVRVDKLQYPAETARAYTEIGRTLAALSRTREAISTTKSALRIFTDLKMDSSRSQVMNEIGFRYWSLDAYDSAIVYLQGSLDLIERTDRKLMKARLINNLGAIHYRTGNYDVGLRHYIQALNLQQELENDYGVSLILSNIGKIYINMGGAEDAMEKFHEALQYGLKSGRPAAIGYAQNNIGELFLIAGEMDSARIYIEVALDTYSGIDHVGGMINTLNNLGSVYIHLGQIEKAMGFLSKSYTLSDSINSANGLAKSLSVMGDGYLYQEDYKQALEHYMSAVELALKFSLRIQLQEDYEKIARIYDLSGDYRNALKYFRLFTTLKDLLNSDRVTDHLNALKIQYDTAETEKENRQLMQIQEQQKLVIAKRTFILTISGITTAIFLVLLVFLIRTSRNLRNANQAISASEKKYRLLVENVNDAIVISQTDKFIYFNAQFNRMLGYTKEDLASRDYRDIYTDKGLEILNQRDRIRKRGAAAPERYETYFRKKDGTIIEVEANVTIIEYKHKQATFAVIRDITERKQAELQQLYLEKQLQQSHKLESMGTMIGGIAHEFNNILQSLFVYSELIHEDLEAHPDIQKNFEMVEKGIKRAGELVRQILSFSRKTDPNSEPHLLQDILPEAVAFVRASLPANISIETEFEPGCKPVSCDGTQIHQLVLNLSSNASRAIQNTEGTLGIFLNDIESDELSGSSIERVVELIITDTGHGMDSETLEKVFDPFYTTQNVGEGTGLGLSVVYGIVQQMRGSITLQSEVDKGTTFRMLFPVANDAVHQSEAQVERMDTETSISLTVLLVDDEEDIRNASSALLLSKGCSVTVASDGDEALKILAENAANYDLVITDFTMPGMTGVELVEKMRKKGYLHPVILSSGVLDPELQKTCLQIGIAGFISKPWTGEQLIESIGRLKLS